jgi:hypothetical protein
MGKIRLGVGLIALALLLTISPANAAEIDLHRDPTTDPAAAGSPDQPTGKPCDPTRDPACVLWPCDVLDDPTCVLDPPQGRCPPPDYLVTGNVGGYLAQCTAIPIGVCDIIPCRRLLPQGPPAAPPCDRPSACPARELTID